MSSNPVSPAPAPHEDYQVINLKYRPQTFAEVIGQRSVVRQLQGDIRDGRVGHAYLFTGPRGVGKTSMARIFAKALNCVEGPTPTPCGKCSHCLGIANDADLDVVEVDAATYTKKEETVELLEGIDRAAFNARYKVYIIDEVHMFSTHSFNVLLKRLEEPPPAVVFILATTNPEKIPETVISRCRRFEFERMDVLDIVSRLKEIADREKFRFAEGQRDQVLEAIALASEGGMRDAQVALDQLISLSEGDITLDTARLLLGVVESDLLLRFLVGLIDRDTTQCLLIVRDLVEKGRDVQRFIKTFSAYLRDAMLIKAGAPEELLKVSHANPAPLKDAVARLSMPSLLNFMQQFLDLEEKLRGAAPARFLLEFTLIKLTAIHPRFVLDSLQPSPAGPGGGGPGGDGAGDRAAPKAAAPAAPPQAPAPAPARPAPRAALAERQAPYGSRPAARASREPVLMRASGAAAAADLPDIDLGEPAAPEIRSLTHDELETFREAALKALPAEARTGFAGATLESAPEQSILVTLPVKLGATARILNRPECHQALRETAQAQFGQVFRFRILEEMPLFEDAGEGGVIDEETGLPIQATASSGSSESSRPAPRISYKEAIDRFPDLREAVDLVRKHCGTDPFLFNGQRIA